MVVVGALERVGLGCGFRGGRFSGFSGASDGETERDG